MQRTTLRVQQEGREVVASDGRSRSQDRSYAGDGALPASVGSILIKNELSLRLMSAWFKHPAPFRALVESHNTRLPEDPNYCNQ